MDDQGMMSPAASSEHINIQAQKPLPLISIVCW